VLEELGLRPRRVGAGDRRNGVGKVDGARGDVNHINTDRRVNIITIEDPIEFLHRDTSPTSPSARWGTTPCRFNAALRQRAAAGARRDPDREIRDMETLDTAAEGGRTRGQPGVLDAPHHGRDPDDHRVISFFPPHQHDEVRHLLSTALRRSYRCAWSRARTAGRVPAAEVLINTAAVQ